jgi:hypothetical protein
VGKELDHLLDLVAYDRPEEHVEKVELLTGTAN